MDRFPRWILGPLAFLLALPLLISSAAGQGLTGQISGSITDPSGAAVAGAEIRINNRETGQERSVMSDAQGRFVFPELLPGVFTLSASAKGFKKYEQQDIHVTATERLTLPAITMQVGAITETVSVTGAATPVQTESAERSGLINTRQMQELPLKGRSYMGTAKLLPGVIDTANRESPGWNDLVGINMSGTRAGSINLNLDGITSLDTGSMTGPYLAPSLDAVAEVKVLLSNYQAEYGRSSGGTINTVIKSGTRDFHGGLYYFLRNEDLNANEWLNNRNGIARPRYRFNNPGYFLGGPVLLPGKFNKNRDKLFFFWSQDFLPLTIPSGAGTYTFPTAAERAGDFSKSSGTIVDPITRQPFAGNIIPASRIDPNGQKLLNLLPLPNTVGPGNQYNWTGVSVNNQPRRDTILRTDYNISSNDQFYVRLIQDYQASEGGFGLLAGLGSTQNWPQLPISYAIHSAGLVSTYIHTFGPNKVNELTFGVNRAKQTVAALTQSALDANNRQKVGLNIPQFFPDVNPNNLIPNATFGGGSVPNNGNLGIEGRFPFYGTNNIWNYSDNFSYIKGSHSMKFGIFVEHGTRNAARSTSFNGTFNFDRDVNNPLDTGHAYSNALLGVVDAYTESNGHPGAHGRYNNVEWYAQDSWKIARRLTLDVGVRFYYIVPTISAGDNIASFDLATYDRSKQPPLIQPYIDPSSGVRVGRDPVTGAIVPAVKIGTFSSNAGTAYQGMKTYKEGLLHTPSIQVTPRIGLAWDVFGNGKTAIRTGFGIFSDRFNDDQILQLVQSPPLVKTQSANYTTINNLLATPLSVSPTSVSGFQQDFTPPAVYNWSFGIQQNVGFNTVLDVAYVGNTQKHLLNVRNLNPIPYGTNFQASSIDPTTSRPYNTNFLRPYIGFQDINYLEFAGIGNYNALQVQVTRRLARNLTYNMAYTWSKALDLVDGIGGAVNPVLNYRSRNYGPAGFDRRHVLTVNYTYNLPNVSKVWNNRATRIGLDGWELSGVSNFQTGAPLGLGYSLTYSADLTGATGNGVDSRSVLVANPNDPAPNGQWFNVNAVKAPLPGVSPNGIGNASKAPIYGPGLNNWDISLFKNFRLGSNESRRLQLRFESYNTFNHTQYTSIDTGARFDQNNNQMNSNYGYFTNAALARRLVVGVKIYF